MTLMTYLAWFTLITCMINTLLVAVSNKPHWDAGAKLGIISRNTTFMLFATGFLLGWH